MQVSFMYLLILYLPTEVICKNQICFSIDDLPNDVKIIPEIGIIFNNYSN